MASEPPTPNIDVGRVVAKGFAALGANFFAFFGFALLLAGVPGFLQIWFTTTLGQHAASTGEAFSFAAWAPLLADIFALFLGGALLQGVLTRSTILHLSGRDPDPVGSALLALRLLLPIIGISICVGFLVVFGLVLLIVPGIIAWCAFAVSVPALVEERRGVASSIGRSQELTRGTRGHVFLIGLFTWILSSIISALTGVVAGVVSGAAGLDAASPDLPGLLVTGAANGLAVSVTAVISSVLIAALYVELREIKEGASANELAGVFA